MREHLNRGRRVWVVQRSGRELSVVEAAVSYCDLPKEGDAVTVNVQPGRPTKMLISFPVDQVYASEKEARKNLFRSREQVRRT